MKTIDDLFLKIRSVYNGLSDSEKRIADYLLTKGINIYAVPISKLSKLCNVSSATWVRFCKSLGFAGLKDFKHCLYSLDRAQSHAKTDSDDLVEFTDIKTHRDIKQLISSIADSSIQAIKSTLSLINFDTLECVADEIFYSKSVRLFAFGASAIVAMDLQQKLIRIGINAIFSDDLHIQLSYASTFRHDDYAIIISNSGKTKEILEIHHKLSAISDRILVITSYTKSPLCKLNSQFIFTASPQLSKRSGAMSSRLAQLTIVDCLFTTMAHRHYNEVEEYLNDSYQSSLEHKYN